MMPARGVLKPACVVMLMAVLAGACSSGNDDATTTSAAESTSTTSSIEGSIDLGSEVAATAARCDPLDDRHCLLPFPSDTFTVADPATDTGRRVEFMLESMPTNVDGVHIDPTEWNRNDGFSPGQPISVFVPGLDLDMTGAATLTDIEASLADDAPIVLLDATTGERWPYWTELDASVDSDEDRVLYIRPAVNYLEGHRIVVAMRSLVDSTGVIAPPDVFRAYRDRLDTGVSAIEARRARYEQVFSDLANVGVDRDDLYLAWDFTIASERNLSERMLHIRDEALAALGNATPTFTVERVELDPDVEIERRITGTFQVPKYLTGRGEPGSRFTNLAGLPEADGEFTANFMCVVPHAAMVAPARASLYGHGLLGGADEVSAGNVRTFADSHNIVFCATDWIGMSEPDIGNAVSILQDVSNMPTLADRGQQGMLNAIFLGRAMTHADGFVTHEAFRNDADEPVIDGSALYYDGNSQGGIMGGALVAVSPDVERAVLGVTAMNYSTLLQRSVDWDTYRAVFDPAYPNIVERGITLSLIQMLWDRAEANGYAQHMTTDPYDATPQHQVLLHAAFGDHQVSVYAAEVEARTIGAGLRCPGVGDGRLPDVTPHWGLPCVADGDATSSVLVIWDSGSPAPPTINLAPNEGRDPHEDPRRMATAQQQKSEWLAEGGTFVEVCGAEPCLADPSD
jgi:hypothetical protein